MHLWHKGEQRVLLGKKEQRFHNRNFLQKNKNLGSAKYLKVVKLTKLLAWEPEERIRRK
jgi:hypothetical protein